ncbi:MAG: T9SS type A sorting domain-containing protein [Lacibacter sp.]
MKKMKFMKAAALFVMFIGTFLTQTFAQTVSLSPTPTATTFVGGKISFTATTSNVGAPITYTWNVTGATVPAGNSATKEITYLSAGTFTVSVTTSGTNGTVTSATTTVTVFQPNLYSAPLSGTGNIRAYQIDQNSGAILNGPVNVVTPAVTTYALGKNKPNLNDASGCLYYIKSSGTNDGIATIYAVKPDGTGTTQVGTIDLNGSSTDEVGFVRLGFYSGKGYIIGRSGSSSSSKIYFTSFRGNGINPISNVTTPVQLTVAAPGSASDFASGDLAITAGGTLYAVASITSGNTYIYTLDDINNPSVITRRWTLQSNGGTFGSNVNGIAWTQSGSMHISSENGLYFVDQSTALAGPGTVQATLISSTTTLSDLASDATPAETTLPISFGELSVKKATNGATVTWTTLSESNNDYFVVERSTDGINYVVAGTVKGAGNSSVKQTYNFNDAMLSATQVVYYRIRQVDLDRKQNLSTTVSLRLDGIRIKNYTAYPNPFTSILKLQLESAAHEAVNIRLINAAGQAVKTLVVSLQKGNNAVILSGLESVKPGLYFLELISSEGIQTQKIFKQ